MCISRVAPASASQQGQVYSSTDFDLVQELAIRIVTIVSDTLAEIIRQISNGLQLAMRKVIAFSVDNIVSLALSERPFTTKIHHLRLNLDEATHNVYWSEACRALASYFTEYLVQSSDFAEKFPAPIRPYWLSALVVDEKVGDKTETQFTITGQITHTFIQNHKTLLFQTFYVNFLRIATHLVQEIKDIQEKDPFILQDFTKELCSKIAHHFEVMHSKVYLGEKPDGNANDITKSALSLIFEHAALDLDFPGPSFIAPHLQGAVWQGLWQTLPGVFNMWFGWLSDQHSMEYFLLKGFEALKAVVDDESVHLQSPSALALPIPHKDMPNQAEFNHVLGHMVENFFTYIDHKIVQELAIVAKRETVYNTIGQHVGDGLQAINLQEKFNTLPLTVLPLMLWGNWEKIGTHSTFKMPPVSLFKTEAQYAVYLKSYDDFYVEVQQKLDHVVKELGTKGKGLKQLAEQQIIGDEPHEIPRKKPFFKRMKEILQKDFHAMENHVKLELASVIIKHLCKEIHHVSNEVYIKMKDRRHAALLCMIPTHAVRYISSKK
jgi:hypothetical protein